MKLTVYDRIYRYYRAADVFVGASRSQLEAMAAELPCVMAHNQGYLGIFTEDKLSVCVDTNFCFRGCEAVSDGQILRDTAALMGMTETERAELGAFGRKVVKEIYSVKRTADDVLAVYESLKKNVVISGYYGSKNHGDDVLLKSIVGGLRTKDASIDITVLSAKPKETAKIYEVNSVHKYNIPKIQRLLKGTRLLISGGGTLIQDGTSSRSLRYYLYIINAAKRRGARVMVFASGIGPVNRAANRGRAKQTLDKVDLITLRDNDSLTELTKLGVTAKAVVTVDAALGLSVVPKPYDGALPEKYCVVAVRKWKSLKEDFERELARFLDLCYDKLGIEPVFVIMQESYDAEISKRVCARLKRGRILNGDGSLEQLVGVIEGAEFAVAMRLHTLIYAAMAAVPVIGLVYDPKVSGMMDMFGQKYYMGVNSLAAEGLYAFAEDIAERRDEIKAELGERTKKMIGEAERNIEYAHGLLKGDG
jgi:polysaccharide pyruvyl transferase CsaB